MSKLSEVKKHLRPGQVYRRADLKQWSNAGRSPSEAVTGRRDAGEALRRFVSLSQKTVFGQAPADDAVLVRTFLKDNRFLLTSPNAYNTLGLGTTQLYNDTVVYNHKRHGRFELGGRVFDFRVKPSFPKSLSAEFLLVDLVNNLERLAEDAGTLLSRVKDAAKSMNALALAKAVRHYGGVRARNFFAETLSDATLRHAA